MSYKFKGQKVIINGKEQIIVPSSLPLTPEDGYLAIDINDGKLKVFNSTKNRWLVLGDAEDVVFDNSSNGFTATNVQDAIEENKTKGRFTIVATFNGSIGNNTWLGYTHELPGNEVPIAIPLNCVLKEITFSYKNTDLLGIPTGSNLIDGRFDIYKNSFSVVNTQISFTNQASPRIVSNVNITFNSGDFFVGRWIDQGDNPSDLAIVYFFEVL